MRALAIPRTTGHVLSYCVAIVLGLISLGGLLWPSTYARETANWTAQAIAQDWFDLAVAAPVIAAATAAAVLGSLRARFVLAGALLFASYTLAIYSFSIHFNGLFLLYCAGLGASVFAFVITAIGLCAEHDGAWFDEALIPRRFAAVILLAIGTLFALLWLAQIVPAMAAGEPPHELAETGLPANPVHVLDLAIILPLHVIGGVALWRGTALGLLLAPVLFGFGALMAASVALLLIVLELRGLSTGWPIAIALAAIAVLQGALLASILRATRARTMQNQVA